MLRGFAGQRAVRQCGTVPFRKPFVVNSTGTMSNRPTKSSNSPSSTRPP